MYGHMTDQGRSDLPARQGRRGVPAACPAIEKIIPIYGAGGDLIPLSPELVTSIKSNTSR